MKKFTLFIPILFLSIFSTYAQLTPVAGNLMGAAGVEADADGNLWVTETGSGANNGRITRVRPNGDKATIVSGLPSFADTVNGEIAGAWRSMLLPNNRLAVIVGEGPTLLFGRIMLFNLTGFQAGVSPAKTVADTTSTIDISRFSLAQTGVTNSNPFSAVLDSDGSWYVADAGANMIVKVAPNGQRSIFARFPRVPNPTPIGPPMVDAVPTKILANPDGGFYVSILTGFPFNVGQAAIYNVDRNGVISTYIRGLTMVTDMALDQRTGDIYAMQFGNFGFAPTPGFVFGSAKVHRVHRGGAFSEVVASNFGPGAGLALDRSGNIYVTSLFTGQLFKMNGPTCGNFEMSITADNDRLSLYNSIKYTLRVTNRGTSAVTNARVYWLPPYKRFEGDAKPFAYQAAYASKGYFDGWHGYWTIENLAAGETVNAYFHLFVVNDRLDATQTAQVVACNQRANFTTDTETSYYSTSLVTKANNQNRAGYAFHKMETILISPNPANQSLNIAVRSTHDKEWHIQMLNSIGQVVFKQNGQYNQTVNIDASALQNGVYIVDYTSAGERTTEKVVVQH